MTKEKHIEKHEVMHKNLDELTAEFLTNNPDKMLANTTLLELITWSHKQTLIPDHDINFVK